MFRNFSSGTDVSLPILLNLQSPVRSRRSLDRQPSQGSFPVHPFAWLLTALVAPVCKETVQVSNMGILQHLHRETRKTVDPKGERWALFDGNVPGHIPTGSLLRLTYRASRSTPAPVSFIGVLLAVRRSSGDPTILVRGIIDDIGVEQVFCLFSPLLEKIEVLQRAQLDSYKKLYSLRERPSDILRMQKTAAAEGPKPAKGKK